MEIKDLIDNVSKGDVQASNNAFDSILMDKTNDALDNQKQNIAQNMYGANEQDIEDAEV